MWTFIAAFVLLTAGHNIQGYDNNLGGFLFHVCPSKHVVSQIKSAHSQSENDRQWEIECKPIDSSLDCSWTGFHKLYEQELNHNCPANQVVRGVFSDYSTAHGDRRWNFFCCSAEKFITFDCRETPMVNYWNEDFNWFVPGENFLTGLQTHNKDTNGDHRWSFNYCRGIKLDTSAVNSQILALNQQMKEIFTEGDVVVPKTRNAKVCDNCRWSKSSQLVQVPYAINGPFSSQDRTRIENAMKAFHLSTCVRFIPQKHQSNYISIVKENGCWSFVGLTGGAQRLSLGDGCVQNGIIQHELIHALGFWHEQSRTDRDIYVKINYENIQSGREDNFKKLETNNLNVPYDYSSVMHYGPKDFSKNEGDTITAFGSSAKIGQRMGMSENDILKINKLYGCKDYLHKNGEWDNELDGGLSRQCPSGLAVSGITSSHSAEKKDRLWGISCKAFEVTRTCRWSPYVNEYWGSMNFKCADNEVIAGAYSKHSNIFEDRKWKFYCCRASGSSMIKCKDTPVVNYWGEYFSWSVPSSNFLTGVKSSFNSQTRDRRWSFSYCQRKAQ